MTARYDMDEEWRTSVAGCGWYTIYADDGERLLYSGACREDAQAIADYERRRTEPHGPQGRLL